MRNRLAKVGFFLLAASATIGAVASASSHEREHGSRRREAERSYPGRIGDPGAELTYRKECGACHVAYAPFLLPAASWQKLLLGLDQHFGQDASLEPEVRTALERWLDVASRGSDERSHGARPVVAGTVRITELAWFQRKHRRIGPEIAQRSSVKTLSNCTACHLGAADWSFDEHRVMIPAE